MEILSQRWYGALLKRRSRRLYAARLIPAEVFEKLTVACNEFRPFDTVRAVFTECSENVFKGIIGAYGKIRGAPFLIAFIGDTRDPYVKEKIGYTGEGIILEATALKLGTCWVGKSFDHVIASSFATTGEHEKVFAVTPIGYASAEASFEEKLLTGFGQTHKREPLARLVSGLQETEWPEWIKVSLLAARVAPSAVNRQPWRFLVESNSITVSVDNLNDSYGISKRLDCGIAMLHIETAAHVCEVVGKWEFLDPPEVARFISRS
ncbi:MAG TPA: nitroreductase [Bacteroidales bacterium]|nr:nitroreductase [Bacteroidales bacterium]